MLDKNKELLISCVSVLLAIIMCVGALYVAIMFLGMQLMPKEEDEDYCILAKSYLENKYDREVIIDEYMYDYHGRPGVRAHFADQSELQFVSHENYDYYLSACLEYEADNMVFNAINNEIQILRVVCKIGSSCREDALFEHYEQKGRPLSWTDDDCHESLDSIRIYYVPIEKFDCSHAKRIVESIVELFYDKDAMNYCMVRLIADSESYSPYNYYFSVKDNRINIDE